MRSTLLRGDRVAGSNSVVATPVDGEMLTPFSHSVWPSQPSGATARRGTAYHLANGARASRKVPRPMSTKPKPRRITVSSNDDRSV